MNVKKWLKKLGGWLVRTAKDEIVESVVKKAKRDQ
jgi:hypothetical protein